MLGRLFVSLCVATLVLEISTVGARAIQGPSFDCSASSRQALAIILCSSPEAARADWEVSSAFWARYKDDQGEAAFNRTVTQKCALPSIETEQERSGRLVAEGLGRIILGPGLPLPPQSPITNRHIACVVEAFSTRAREIRSELTGDALREAMQTPEEHIAVQEDLLAKNLLVSRVNKYGVKADGQFGPNTRLAIKEFQRSLGAPETSYLAESQRIALADTPERRAARLRADEIKQKEASEEEVRRVAREKERQDAIEVRRQAALDEEKRRLELIRLRTEEIKQREAAEEEARRVAREKEKQNAIEAQRRFEEQEKRRLEIEAAQASEWRRKIDEAKKKGTEYASATDLGWSLVDRNNPMTDDKEFEVQSTQLNGTGALAKVEGRCLGNEVEFLATLFKEKEANVPLGFVSSSVGGLVGRKRLNDEPVFATSFANDKWRNKFILSQLRFRDGALESADTTWRILTEIETSQGTLYIRIPTFDPKIQKLISACKTQWEIEQRKQGTKVPG